LQNEDLELKCKVSSNPEASVVWYKNDNTLVHMGETLVLKNNKQIDGEYTCHAKVPGFESIFHKTAVISSNLPFLFGKQIYIINKMNNIDVLIEFTALSNPAYLVIEYFFNFLSIF
jgi:hypothetical protein